MAGMAEAELAALVAEHEELLSFLYICPIGVLRVDAAGAVQMMNAKAAQLLMPLAQSPMIANLFDAMSGCAPELRNMAAAFAPASGPVCENHRVFVGRSGPGPAVLSCTLLKIDPCSFVVLLSDVSGQVEQERRLRQAETWFNALIAGVNDFALFTLDGTGAIDSWNASGLRQTGFEAAEVLGGTLHRFYHPDEDRQGRAAEHVNGARREGWHLDEGWCARRDGSRFWCQILVAAISDPDNGPGGSQAGFSVVLRDTTERRMTGEELRRLLTTDHLTGAVNRAHFDELAERELAHWRRHGAPLSAILLDIDHFKQVNDTFGHQAGDKVLKALVAVCRAELRGSDILARLGGEEFAVLLPGTDLPGAVDTAQRLRAAVARDLARAEDLPVGATISLGCAAMTDDCAGLDALLSAADEALYRAKRLGRNRVEVHGAEMRVPGALQLAVP